MSYKITLQREGSARTFHFSLTASSVSEAEFLAEETFPTCVVIAVVPGRCI